MIKSCAFTNGKSDLKYSVMPGIIENIYIVGVLSIINIDNAKPIPVMNYSTNEELSIIEIRVSKSVTFIGDNIGDYRVLIQDSNGIWGKELDGKLYGYFFTQKGTSIFNVELVDIDKMAFL